MADNDTKVHAIYGLHVSHSLSPVIFNKTFEKMGLNRTYVPFSVRPAELGQAVEAARVLGFDGFNVTMPHKTSVVPFLDRLEGPAEKIGSVNTVAKTSRGLVGHNTDGEGALRALKAYGFDPKNRAVLVLGAGGTSRALVHSLSQEGADIVILNRTPEKARAVAEIAQARSNISIGKLTRSEIERSLANSELIINTTPVQTASLLESLGLPILALPNNVWLFDLAYDKPPEHLNVPVHRISPLEMLVQQAAIAYAIWLGEPAPLELMQSILADHNGGDWK